MRGAGGRAPCVLPGPPAFFCGGLSSRLAPPMDRAGPCCKIVTLWGCLYADDTQLYISFTPSNSTSSLEMLSNTFSDILSWMNSNKLLLNPSKTEFLLIGTKQQRLKFSQLTTLSLGNDIIPVSSSARNLGFIFDSDMSFTDQINSLSKSCHFHIRDIRRIRHPSSFCSYSACQFTRLQQTGLLQFTLQWHFAS